MKHITTLLLTLLVLGGCSQEEETENLKNGLTLEKLDYISAPRDFSKESWELARKYFQSGNKELAMVHLRLSAEGGYPIAQYTLGLFTLDKSHPLLSLIHI